jgi:hypothetical protein
MSILPLLSRLLEFLFKFCDIYYIFIVILSAVGALRGVSAESRGGTFQLLVLVKVIKVV